MKKLIVIILLCFGISKIYSQTYKFEASAKPAKFDTTKLKMVGINPNGETIKVNNCYLSFNQKPVIPVMGEVHFSRVPKEQWEDVVLKMKACGITIVATYILWIHHEEIEGRFDWTGNKDLRAFAKLCAKHELWLYPRIGPWCHAEVRNGGTPDWILTKTNLKDRSNNPVYQYYAEEWYKQIALQLQGLLFKDGGYVIGIQLENEYRRGKSGEDHIMWLKNTALKHGLNVPLYTVTGWQNGSVPPYEVIPLWGAYPDAPWAENLIRSTDRDNFKFTPFRDSDNIGNEVKNKREQYVNPADYPYFTCEMGVGIMNTNHRRLQIGNKDGLGLVLAKIGSGSNLPGYYMFAGGSNPHGILTSMEENKEEIGYYNTNPVVSYDFYAAIRESGKLNDSYFEVKKLHYFLNEFGKRLAPMIPVTLKKEGDFQCILRTSDNSGFLFGLNYCRHNMSAAQKNVRFSVQFNNETIDFPSRSITIPDSAMFVWPVNFKMDNINLKYATSQPLCQIKNTWIFIEDADSSPEFCFNTTRIKNLSSSCGKIDQKDGNYIVSGLNPGLDCVISIQTKNKDKIQIIVLSRNEALQSWLFKNGSEKHFFISESGLYMNEERLHVFGTNNNFKFYKLNPYSEEKELFTSFEYSVPEKTITPKIIQTELLYKAEWLKTGVDKQICDKNILQHRFFLKEFSLGNPSKVKKAELIIAPQTRCNVQINNVWINTDITVGTINRIDITGYAQKGDNKLLLDFPFETGDNVFAAKVIVEYFNTDRTIFSTNQSWITRDAYNYPSYLTNYNGFQKPEIIKFDHQPVAAEESEKYYMISLPERYLDGLNNLFLNIEYTGDKGKLYYNHQLIADDFYNGAIWQTGLNRLHFPLENQPMILELSSLPADERVYFDNETAKREATTARLKNIHLVPEYSIDLIVTKKGCERINE